MMLMAVALMMVAVAGLLIRADFRDSRPGGSDGPNR